MSRFVLLLTLACSFGLTSIARAAIPQTTRVFLSGTDSRATVDWEFLCSAGAKAGTWTTIPVPSNWEMHGFGTLSYGSVTPAETGHYRRRFSAPTLTEGERVFLVFDGVMTDATVRLNGQPVGEKHQGGFYRFSREITTLLHRTGENLLEVDVNETSADAGVNRAERTGDYWNFGGIFRPVWLEIVPAQFIGRLAVDARADGSLAIHAFVQGHGAGTQLRARVLDAAGREVGAPHTAPQGAENTVLKWKVEGVAPWTAETPRLYTAEVALVSATGEVVHQVEQRIGFRTFEVREGEGLYLNGTKIVLQGVNRHSFNATTGRCLNEEDHRTDIRLMKEMNMNAVRMSHYPPDTRFLELCDELGLYVLDELAGWQKAYDTDSGRQLVREMVIRDVNHPSILFWDNGNEGGWNTKLDDDFARWDPSARPVLHPWGIAAGINTAHYKVYPQAQALARGFTTSWNYDPKEVPKMGAHPLIYMPTEFLHGLFDGGAGAGLEDYWTMMRASPTLGGGFLWVFRDEGVQRADDGRIDVRGNGAPDGLVGPFGEKEASFYTVKELWSPLPVTGQLPAEGDVMKLRVENRYGFTDASQCTYTWRVRRLAVGTAAGTSDAVIAAGDRSAFPPVAPGKAGTLKLVLPPAWRTADVLEFGVQDPSGTGLWTYTWPLPGLHRLRELPGASEPVAGAAAASIVEGLSFIELRAGGVIVRLGRESGQVTDINAEGKHFSLRNGPRLVTGEGATLLSLEASVREGAAVATATFKGALEQVEWRLRPNGWLDCTYAYRPEPEGSAQGVAFDYPSDQVRAKRWIGAGPYRVWQNRLKGVSFGEWANDYNDTVTGWSGWVYPEFKGCFADVRWLELVTGEGTLRVVTHSDDQFVQVLKPAFAAERLQKATRMELPDAGLAFLDAIPPIGSKFTRPELMGPQGGKPALKPVYRHTVSFFFGP